MSPYENLPDTQWKKVTKKLVNEHPLSSDILIDTVLEAWKHRCTRGTNKIK